MLKKVPGAAVCLFLPWSLGRVGPFLVVVGHGRVRVGKTNVQEERTCGCGGLCNELFGSLGVASIQRKFIHWLFYDGVVASSPSPSFRPPDTPSPAYSLTHGTVDCAIIKWDAHILVIKVAQCRALRRALGSIHIRLATLGRHVQASHVA